LARRLESFGFDTLLVADHFANAMACTPLIATAAAATERLRVGSYVYSNDFRHPALLAKEAATIDVLSNGRMELGVGAGWLKEEYDQVGLTFDEPRKRADRFEEAIRLILEVMAGGTISFAGEHYQLENYVATPVPVQDRIPLLIGGGGPRMIRVAARHADIFGLVPRSLAGGGLDLTEFAAPAVERKLHTLDEALHAEGRKDGGPERSALLFGIFGSIDECKPDGWVPRELVEASPHSLVGEPSRVADTLLDRREWLGVSYYVCFDYDLERMAPIVAAVRTRDGSK
jgi:probable F420-dependent oxidoreductase